MKIGILTFHDALNVGAVLQAFALQSYLESIGHCVEFINYSCRPAFSFKRIIGRTVGNTISKLSDFYNFTKFGSDKKYNSVLHISAAKYNAQSLHVSNIDYDAFIVGSDQVWNFRHTLNPVYLLSFVNEHKKKIAYAVSMGQCDVDDSLHESLRKSLLSFDYISSREKKACDFLNNLLGESKHVSQCIDPTLLIPSNLYKSITLKLNEYNFISSYILNSLNTHQINQILDFSKSKELPLVNLRNPDTCIKLKKIKNIIVNPYEWLWYMENSKYTICGSFHATVFSLIFHKQFVVIESEDVHNAGGNQRVRSLLRPLGLEDRCICNEPIDSVIDNNIDWDMVDKKLDNIRKQSVLFLTEALS